MILSLQPASVDWSLTKSLFCNGLLDKCWALWWFDIVWSETLWGSCFNQHYICVQLLKTFAFTDALSCL